MTPEERQMLYLGRGGRTTLDALLDVTLELATAQAAGAVQSIAMSAQLATAAVEQTRQSAAVVTIAAEATKHTALLIEIRDQLKRGLLVKTVVTL